MHLVSALRGDGMEAVLTHLVPGHTVVVLGSSGAGKSTLLNRLVGSDLQRVGAVRQADHRGRHTTSSRRLVLLEGGALILDTPGMRELEPWDAEDGLDSSFADVLELTRSCRFRDCTHGPET